MALPEGQDHPEETPSSPQDTSPPSTSPSAHQDGPDPDPSQEPPSEQPQPTEPRYSTFPSWEKKAIVLASAFAAFFSPLSAQIYLPALNTLAEDFHVSSAKINLTVTTYMIFQGLTPMFIGSFADSFGRRPAYVICFVVYIAANTGLALAPNYASLLVLRCLQSAGSSSTVSLCVAVGADIVTSAERGQYIGYTAVPTILGPSLGPVIGGLLVQYLDWRAIFWFLVIFAGATFAAIMLFFPETCRKIVGDGSIQPPTLYLTFPQALKQRKARASLEKTNSRTRIGRTKLRLPNPFSSLILLFEKGLGLLLSIGSVALAGFYAIAAAMPSQLSKHYGLSDLQVGLMYLPMAGGSVAAAAVVGSLINKNYARHCHRLGIPVDKSRQYDLADFPIERARLEIGTPLLYVCGAVIVSWGWAMQQHAPLAVIGILLFLMGTALIGFTNSLNVLVTDVSPGRAATAAAALNLTRCLVGAGATAAIVPMINGIGVGWACTVFGALYVAASPGLFILMRKGVAWRKESTARHDKREAAYQARQSKTSPQEERVLSESPSTNEAEDADEKKEMK